MSEHAPAPTDSPSQDHLLDHEYDGIQEYDNPLPRWWVLLFWATILFSPLYIVFYHFGPGELEIDRYDAAMVSFYDQQATELLAMGEVSDQLLAGLQGDAAMMKGAKKVFQNKCAACHGMLGEGGIGPNLTDPYWLHGGRLEQVYTVVSEGVPSKGMLSWKRQLRPAELLAVSSFVGTLAGSEPPNPKAPQGTLYEAPPATAPVAAGEVAPEPAATPVPVAS